MTITVRLAGEPDEISALIEHLREAFDVAGGDRAYPNRGSFGVRVYLGVRRLRETQQRHVRSERLRQTRTTRQAGEEIEP